MEYLVDTKIDGKVIRLKLIYPYPIEKYRDEIQLKIKESYPDYNVEIDLQWKVRRHKVQNNLKPLSVIKNIIAVASGKGGVGKSTVAVNLALALQQMGAKVGILDADIYGPSQPRMLGQVSMRAKTQGKKLIPIESYGMPSISIGYLVDDDSPMIWRGPMVSNALQQLLNETAWPELDYLIIDLPPGTGDIQLTLAQKIPLAGAVVVTTPQDIALCDVKKACHMFAKVGVSVLGIVENMSTYHCPCCGHEAAIFGQGGGEALVQEFNVPLLGQIPLVARIRELSDGGAPVIIAEPNSEAAKPFWEIARKTVENLAKKEIDYSASLPKVVLQT